jgi:hypothetical protein
LLPVLTQIVPLMQVLPQALHTPEEPQALSAVPSAQVASDGLQQPPLHTRVELLQAVLHCGTGWLDGSHASPGVRLT